VSIETDFGYLTQEEVLEALGIVSADDPKLVALAGTSWGGNALKVLQVNATENGWQFAAVGGGSGATRSAAKVTKAANQTGISFTAGHNVAWDTESFDDSNWFVVAAPTRFTVPAGVTRARIGATVRLANVTGSAPVTLTILKNGATTVAIMTTATSAGAPNVSVVGYDACAPGDFYEVNVFVNDADANIVALGSNFWIEAA
jgi:hypothetical protein